MNVFRIILFTVLAQAHLSQETNMGMNFKAIMNGKQSIGLNSHLMTQVQELNFKEE